MRSLRSATVVLAAVTAVVWLLILVIGASDRAALLMGFADMDDQLSRAMVIDPTTLSGEKVVFGATVSLLDEDGKKIRYQLVGQVEADAKVGRISFNSPLGRALIGREVGEDVEVSAPGGDKYYQIKKIEVI